MRKKRTVHWRRLRSEAGLLCTRIVTGRRYSQVAALALFPDRVNWYVQASTIVVNVSASFFIKPVVQKAAAIIPTEFFGSECPADVMCATKKNCRSSKRLMC